MRSRAVHRIEQSIVGDYFARLGALGPLIEASDHRGRSLEVDTAIVTVVDRAAEVKAQKGRVFFVGNGGSAAIASHMAADWLKNGGFSALCFNDASQLTCLGNDLGVEKIFSVPIEQHGREGDLLMAISSSGNSQNILAAVRAARRIKARVVTLSGFEPQNLLRKLGDVNFWVPDSHYGFVEIGHLMLCHAILDIAMGWRQVGDRPVARAAAYR
jgi:D-sedoheptulose 7-phosphate isomerase